MQLISEKLKDARKRKRLSQENVAAITSISKSRISDIEKTGNLSAKQLQCLCVCYEISSDMALGLSDDRLVHQEDKCIVEQWHGLNASYKAAGRMILHALFELQRTQNNR